VTTLAELRCLTDQEGIVVAPMGHVAGHAIFVYRWMPEHEGAPLYCMALIAEFIHRISLDHFWAKTAMGIVTIKT
jgi:hypothetical protein